ncbi:hypothetical protein Glove_87g6 [Diversispora epigaea]|uniref:non-specific serine/threonine protein kinase n=1 Tax=Diversispora epigaea TaxID=1348612 RepID=A0A397J6E1_9GLOM|nr:hypothetical protein Glove_87g6 [Diversispora epigaea]
MLSDKICPECNREYTSYRWCKPCNSKHFQNDFDKWTKWDVENQQWKRLQRDVALKKFDNFACLNEYYLNEIEIHLKTRSDGEFVSIRTYGITKDSETNEYILVLQYMDGGNLRDYLKNNFNIIDWKLKLSYLNELASNFSKIHKLDIIHHDFHPGNILSYNFKSSILYISDFGLSKLIGQDIKNPEKREIFGVMPYIAPEVLSGEEYTKAADVYSFGIIAYEIVTGFAPYYDIPHDRDLARQIYYWYYYITNNEIANQIENSEKSRSLGLTTSTTSTPMNYKTHPEAIYTSRLLSYSSLPKPKNDENFENELEKLTKSTSALSIAFTKILTFDIKYELPH